MTKDNGCYIISFHWCLFHIAIRCFIPRPAGRFTYSVTMARAGIDQTIQELTKDSPSLAFIGKLWNIYIVRMYLVKLIEVITPSRHPYAAKCSGLRVSHHVVKVQLHGLGNVSIKYGFHLRHLIGHIRGQIVAFFGVICSEKSSVSDLGPASI